MTLALALIYIGGCAWYAWLIFSQPPLELERAASDCPSVRTDAHLRTPHDAALERLAARVDDLSATLAEIQAAVASGRPPDPELDGMQTALMRAAADIDPA